MRHIILILSLLLLVGCELEEPEPEQIDECETDDYCERYGGAHSFVPFACFEVEEVEKCVKVDCVTDLDCNWGRMLGSSYDVCEEYNCVDPLPRCLEVAKKDYNFSKPECSYYLHLEGCTCEDYIIDRPQEEIERNNSIEIIPEQGHIGDVIQFKLKGEE